jgi:hypothetical protein
MRYLSRTLSSFLHERSLAEPGLSADRLGNEPSPANSFWETGYFIGAMLLIFAVAIILALAISST